MLKEVKKRCHVAFPVVKPNRKNGPGTLSFRNFEERIRKCLDVKHLGYEKLSELVALYSHLVLVNSSSSGPLMHNMKAPTRSYLASPQFGQ